MTTAYSNQIETARASYSSDIDGLTFDVSIRLTGVAGNSVCAVLNNALASPLIPLKGTDPTAVDPALIGTGVEGCWLSKIEAEVIRPREVMVYLHYQHSPADVVRVRAGSNLSQIETNKDKNGDAISLEYTYPSTYEHKPELAGKTVKQGGTITLLKPEITREYEIREPNDPTELTRLYGGKTNSTAMHGTGDVDSPDYGTWMLASINGSSDNNNSGTEYWNNVYVFQYREDGWNPEAAFNDPNTGDPPPDLVADTGIKTVDRYDKVDFKTLLPNLNIPT